MIYLNTQKEQVCSSFQLRKEENALDLRFQNPTKEWKENNLIAKRGT